jgi:hypothetical protein
MRVTIACPEARIADANQLARCLGLGPDDDKTYGAAQWIDGAGNRYAVAGGVVGPNFSQSASSPLIEPGWGCDLAAAQRAQALIQIGQPAAPDRIAAVFGDDAMASLAAMGLVLSDAG